MRKPHIRQSLHELLKEDGFKVIGAPEIRDREHNATLMALVNLRVARGEYKEIAIIPSNIAFRGHEMTPIEQRYIFYAKPSKKYKERTGIYPINCRKSDNSDGDIYITTL